MTEENLLYGAKRSKAACMATKDRQINIRFEPRNYQRLKRQAEAEHRTVSNLLERLALEYLDQCEKKTGKKNV
jgi:hypothetical protein